MHHVVIGSDTYEIVDQYAREHGASIALDTTLTEAGKAADAKAVGDAIAAIEGGGGSVIVDPTLSSTSTHPVQNKAIYEAIENAKASPYTNNPAAPGTASPGSSSLYSRGDHVHPLPANATTSAAGLMSAQDKSRLDDLYDDYSSALTALG